MTEKVDMLVIGGGIHGVGVAQAAAAAGHSVLLVEKTRLAAGTSSRSSKLIHGGLRYLEGFHFGVVRECLRERRILLRIAGDLVRMDTFHLPVYAGGRRPPWLIGSGLGLYALLAGFAPGSGFSRLGTREIDALPGLRREGLRTVFRFQDGRTDDRLLTCAVMHSAIALGARLWQPAECLGAELNEEGAVARIRRGSREQEVLCRVLVNAAGPWVGEMTARIRPRPPETPFELIQGSHVVIQQAVVDRCYYMENPRDGRGVFMLPWEGSTLVGTTETRFQGPPDRVAPRPAEIRYLKKALRHFFPDCRKALQGPVAAFAGLRVLPSGSGHAFQRSRETRLVADRDVNPRLISIYGGKLTAYRATAQKVLARAAAGLPRRQPAADTAILPLKPAPEVLPSG
ncbi:MAG: FAD-dependent oxidoreductase [Gammaproteobacteria bacterium]